MPEVGRNLIAATLAHDFRLLDDRCIAGAVGHKDLILMDAWQAVSVKQLQDTFDRRARFHSLQLRNS